MQEDVFNMHCDSPTPFRGEQFLAPPTPRQRKLDFFCSQTLLNLFSPPDRDLQAYFSPPFKGLGSSCSSLQTVSRHGVPVSLFCLLHIWLLSSWDPINGPFQLGPNQRSVPESRVLVRLKPDTNASGAHSKALPHGRTCVSTLSDLLTCELKFLLDYRW